MLKIMLAQSIYQGLFSCRYRLPLACCVRIVLLNHAYKFGRGRSWLEPLQIITILTSITDTFALICNVSSLQGENN